MKAALIIANGFEEGEALTIADIIRRAELQCDLIGLDALELTGTHSTVVRCDGVMDDTLLDYDMVILPGGYGGRDNMLASEALASYIRQMDEAHKWVCAICAAPEVLDQAGVLNDRRCTCYPGVKENIKHGTWCDETLVIDGHIVTGMGPALAYQFAYKLVELLGGNAEAVKQRMVYDHAFHEGGC